MTQNYLNNIFEKFNYGFLIINSKGIISEFNNTACLHLEIPANKILGTRIPHKNWELFNTDEKKLSINEFPTIKFFQTDENVTNEVFGLKLQKKTLLKWLEINIVSMNKTNNNLSDEAYVILKDITEKTEYQKERLNELMLLKTVINSLPDAIFAKDKDLRKILTNKADLRNIGLSEEEVLGKTDYEIFPEDYARKFTSDDLEVLMKNKEVINHEEKITDSEGNKKWLSTSKVPLKNAIGEIIGLIGIGHDISEKKKMEKQLAINQYGIENINISIFMTQDDSRITYVNQYACDSLGYTKKELVGMRVFDINPNFTPETWKEYRAEIEENQTHTVHSRIKRKDGTLFPAEITSTYFKYDDKLYSYSFVTDITERETTRKELEEKNRVFEAMNIEYIRKNEELSDSLEYISNINQELGLTLKRAEESDKLKSAFLANLSHEFRTPMNGILGFAQLLKQQILTDIPNLDYIDMIQTNGKRLIDLITDIVDLSRIQAGQVSTNLTQINLVNLLQDVISTHQEIADKNNIDLIFSPEDVNNIFIETDGPKLETALTKILNNALKYTEEGYIKISAKTTKNTVEIMIQDTGIGIHPDMGEKIYEIFMQGNNEITRQYEGLGVGLSIAKAYTQAINGTLSFDSEPDQGTTFKIRLPIKYIQPESVRRKKKMDIESLKVMENKKILVINSENNSEIIQYLKMTFKTNHAIFFPVDNMRDAIEIIERENGVDMIVLNINSSGLDLLQAIKDIKKTYKNIRIVALTSPHSVIKKNVAQNAGCDVVLKENINRTKLLEKIIENL